MIYTSTKKGKEKHKNRFPNFASLSMKIAPKREVHFIILHKKVRTGIKKKKNKI